MKKSLIALSVFFFSTLLPAQDVFKWSDQQIITDTISVYANPFVSSFSETAWVFYEKHENFKSIYKMDLNSLDDSVQLLLMENINYSNPYFQVSGGSFLGHLFYLSDEEGADNLYVAKLFENDSLGTAIKVVENPDNKDVMYAIAREGYIGYTIDSNIYAAELRFYTDSVFTENVVLLDSSSFNAQIISRTLVWQKIENDSSHIFISNYEFDSDSGFLLWEEPYCVDSVGNSQWLTTSRTIDYMGGDEFCWVKGDTVLGFSNSWYNDLNTINTFSQPNVRQLSMVNWYVMVKYPYEEPHYLCFATGEGNESEIFSSHGEMGWEDSAYISNNNYPDDNPRVFYGESIDSYQEYYVYCIWQSHINNGIALSMAKSIAFIWGSVDENSITDNFLKVSPNPFNDRLNININTHGEIAEVRVLNVQGQQVASYQIHSNNDWQTINWHPTTKLPKGVYLVVLIIEGKEYVRKVVLQ